MNLDAFRDLKRNMKDSYFYPLALEVLKSNVFPYLLKIYT
jgi:hypothetical protein